VPLLATPTTGQAPPRGVGGGGGLTAALGREDAFGLTDFLIHGPPPGLEEEQEEGAEEGSASTEEQGRRGGLLLRGSHLPHSEGSGPSSSYSGRGGSERPLTVVTNLFSRLSDSSESVS
jgi:hypothetical protein